MGGCVAISMFLLIVMGEVTKQCPETTPSETNSDENATLFKSISYNLIHQQQGRKKNGDKTYTQNH